MSKRRADWQRVLVALSLSVVSIIWLLPIAWTILVSFRPPNEPIASGHIWFGSSLTLENYVTAFRIAPFGTYYLNTLLIVFGILLVQLVTITLAGYAFARYAFRGRDLLFALLLLQILIPSAVLLVPNYATIRNLTQAGLPLFDSQLAIMLPYFGSAFGTFLIRQTFKGVPRDLDDAARMDGANWLQVLRFVYLPSSTPALVAFALASITFHWNDFLWPLVLTNSERARPLTVGLAVFTQMGELGAQWPLVTAATLIVAGPLFILFLLFQRQFINSLIRSGLK